MIMFYRYLSSYYLTGEENHNTHVNINNDLYVRQIILVRRHGRHKCNITMVTKPEK